MKSEDYLNKLAHLDEGEMEIVLNLQMHRHAKTCKRSGNNVCRFNFPLPPMPRTVILKTLDEKLHDEKESKLIKENSEKNKQILDDMKYGEDISFEDVLKKIRIN